MIRRGLIAVSLMVCGACRSSGSYLFLWAGDADRKQSDFLAVIDASPRSAHYGSIVASIPTGVVGAHPHHTEQVMPADEHLLANGFHAGRTWVFDLSKPLEPRIVTSFGDVAGYSHPHTFIRLANGDVLGTFQYRAGKAGEMEHGATHEAMPKSPERTGGLVEMDERGNLIRSKVSR